MHTASHKDDSRGIFKWLDETRVSRATTKEAPRRDIQPGFVWGWKRQREGRGGAKVVGGLEGAVCVLEKEIGNVRLGGQNAK